MQRNREVQDLIDWFVVLEGASQVYGLATDRNPAALAARDNDRHPFHSLLAGKIFELFGYNYQKAKVSPPNQLLTPRATLFLYAQATQHRIHKTKSGNQTIHEVNVPDGIEFSESPIMRRIEKLHEYKPSQQPGRIARQMASLLDPSTTRENLRLRDAQEQVQRGNSLANFIQSRDHVPLLLAPDFELRYTALQNSVLRTMALPPRVSVDYLPIHTLIFRELTTAILEESVDRNLGIPSTPRVLS